MSTDQKNETTSAAVAAAAWWADAIGGGLPGRDNGMDGMGGMLALMQATTVPDAPKGSGEAFVAALAPRLQADLDRSAGEWSVCVGVDYGPDPILADAAREVGISTGRFPWKTNMWIHADHVTVSAGYGAGARLVWASDEWQANRPTCGSQKWDERQTGRDYNGEPWACSLPKYHESAHDYSTPLALCTVCGRADGWYHDEDERGHMPNFHVFAAPVVSGGSCDPGDAPEETR